MGQPLGLPAADRCSAESLRLQITGLPVLPILNAGAHCLENRLTDEIANQRVGTRESYRILGRGRRNGYAVSARAGKEPGTSSAWNFGFESCQRTRLSHYGGRFDGCS